MNRDALLLYLRDLRDLEVAKYQITKTINQNTAKTNTMTQNLQREINQAQQPNYWERPKLPEKFLNLTVVGASIALFVFLMYSEMWTLYVLLFLVSLGTVAVSFFGMCFTKIYFLMDLFFYSLRAFLAWLGSFALLFFTQLSFVRDFKPLYLFVTLIGVGIVVLAYLKYMPAYTKECKAVENHNQQEQERLNHAPAVVQDKSTRKQEIVNSWKKKDAILKNDLQKANALLQKAYGHNLLASTYRNLASVYYIYDYMSTSTATLEETLIHEHMENGIQRILSKLDVIIGKQEEQILSARRIECNTKTIIDQNTHMLDTLQQTLASQLRTEQNTLETAQYARIATTYAQTTAFFSSATYFQNGGSLLIW